MSFMNPKWRTIAVLLLSFATLAARPAHAAWSNTGNPLANSGIQEELVRGVGSPGVTVCPDGGGGLICAYVLNDLTVRINRLDEATGNPLWGATGSDVTVSGSIATNSSPFVLSDRSGGAWVAWVDVRATNPGLYVQRFDPAGAAQFAAGGIRVGTMPLPFWIDVTPSGQLLVAFSNGDIRFQRVSLAGALQLGASGVQISTNSPEGIMLSDDGAGGAVISWSDFLPVSTVSRYGVFANRVNSAGTKLWGASGVTVILDALINATYFQHVWDGSSLLLSWVENDGIIDVNGEALPIRAQKLNSSGVKQWGAGGVSVFVPLDTPWDVTTISPVPQLVSDGAGGAEVAWLDGRDYDRLGTTGFKHREDIYGQRLNASGVKQWPANGAVIDTLPGAQNTLRIVSDGAGGMIEVCRDFFATNDGDIKAQRFDSNALRLWVKTVTPVTVGADGVQENPSVASDGLGGVVLAWEDQRNDPPNGTDVYATHRTAASGNVVAPSVTVVTPNGGETLHSLEPFDVTWTSQNLGTLQVRIEYTVDGGARQLAVGSDVNPTANDGHWTWYVPDVASSNVRLFVETVGATAEDQSDAVFSICRSLAPVSSAVPTGGVRDLEVADLNEDGIPDLVLGLIAVANGLEVRLGGGSGGVGDGTFPTSVSFTTVNPSALGVAVADFNEDGHLDVAYTDDGVAIRLGNGSGSPVLGADTHLTPGVFAIALETADVNVDGIADLIAIGSSVNGARVFLGQGVNGVGNGTFAAPTSYTGAIIPRGGLLADVNEDDALDLVLCGGQAANSGLGCLAVFLGLKSDGVPNGAFGPATISAFGGEDPQRLAIGDLNQDGILDLAIACGTQVKIMRGLGSAGVGNGTFVEDAVLPFGSAFDAAIGDLNGDGQPDLLVGEATGLTPATYFGPYPLTAGGALSTGTSGLIALGDFLEDGAMDAVVCKNGAPAAMETYAGECPSPLSTTIATSQPGAGAVVAHGTSNFFDLSWSKGAGVVAVDVALSRDSGSHWETIARRQIGPRFHWRVTGPDGNHVRVRVSDATVQNRSGVTSGDFAVCAALDGGLPLSIPSKVTGLAVGDFNEDGNRDLAISGTDDLYVRLATGSGGYGSTITIPTPLLMNGIVVGDVNDDGIEDLIGTSSTGLTIARGRGTGGVGNGTFDPATSITLGRKTTAIATADFNQDGILDLVAVNPDQDLVTVLLGNGANGTGDGTFNAFTYATGDQPQQVAIGELNGDGVLDLAITNRGSNSVSILLGVRVAGVGSGTFAAATSFPAGTSPVGLAMDDFEMDSFLDLAVTNDVAAPTVSLLRGLGNFGGPNGTFAAPVSFATLASPQAIALTDLNDDGRTDILVLSAAKDSLVAYQQAGSFAFNPGAFVQFDRRLVGDNPSSALVTDLNGDFVPDVAVGDLLGGDVRVFTGPCPAATRATLSVVVPSTGQSLPVGSNNTTIWSELYKDPVDIEISHDGGANWESLRRGAPAADPNSIIGLSHASWTVPPPATSTALIRMCERYNGTRCDTSGVFTITASTLAVGPDGVPATMALSSAWPNPSRGDVRFALALPNAADVQIEVFDVAGRRVRTLASGTFSAGWHSIHWDGREDSGHPSSSGLYLVRARSGNFVETRRVIRAQ